MFSPSAVSSNELLAKLIIEELYRYKIDRYFVSPGSRSTPLTVEAASDKRVKASIHVDERGAAFQAIGYARAAGKPGVLICTSGTAPSNYYPAVLEAEADSIPLIVLSADRPPSLQNVSANQTTDQVELYYHHVKSFLNIKPTDSKTEFKQLLESFSELVSSSFAVPQGPVHVNLMFDEPLAPIGKNKSYTKQFAQLSQWCKSSKPLFKNKTKRATIIEFPKFDPSYPTILIAGHLKSNTDAAAVLEFAEQKNLPVFADIRSKLRFGTDSKNIVTCYDSLLKSNKLSMLKNVQVIHVGGNIVSKRLHQFIERVDIGQYIVLHDTPYPFNAHHKMTEAYQGSISKLISSLEKNVKPFQKMNLKMFQDGNGKIESYLSQMDIQLSEVTIPRLVVENIRSNSFIFAASSMPVRDFDMFAQTTSKKIPVFANRGLSGIDGTIASFTGASDGLNKSGVLVIGDLAFFHDINSLALVKKSKHPLVIILINNKGGGIFSFLPIANRKDIFEDYFGVGQNIDFKAVVEGFKLDYHKTVDSNEFIKIFKKMQQSKTSGVIEIDTNRDENYKLHQKMYKEISDILNK